MKHEKTEQQQKAFAKLTKLIEDIQVAMMTTVDESGGLRARPMWTHGREFDGRLYFFTHASATKVDEVQKDAHVCITYAEPKDQRFVSVTGRAHLTQDRKLLEQLWTPAYKAWFPEGLDDADLAMLVVDAERAEYWDAPNSKMVHLFGALKATVTGRPAKGGRNEKVEVGEESPSVH